MERYPSFLPLAQLSKEMKTNAGFRELAPSIGLPIFKKVTDDLTTTFGLRWVFTREQARSFEAFIRTGLDNGSNWFIMPINVGASGIHEQEVHFTVSGFPQKRDLGGVIEYQGQVVAKKINDPTKGNDIFYLLPSEFSDVLDKLVNETNPVFGSR